MIAVDVLRLFFFVHEENRALRVNYKCDIKRFDFDVEDKVLT